MKGKLKSLLLIFMILIVVLALLLWNQKTMNLILKPFSEPCGYGGTSDKEVECACEGKMIRESKDGATAYYCLGSCSQCKCYSINLSDGTKKEEDCATFSQLSWAFPVENKLCRKVP